MRFTLHIKLTLEAVMALYDPFYGYNGLALAGNLIADLEHGVNVHRFASIKVEG